MVEPGKNILVLFEKEALWEQKDLSIPMSAREEEGFKLLKEFRERGAWVLFIDDMKNYKIKSELKSIAPTLLKIDKKWKRASLNDVLKIPKYLDGPDARLFNGIFHVTNDEHKKDHFRRLVTHLATKMRLTGEILIYHIYSSKNDNIGYKQEMVIDNFPLPCTFQPIFYSPNTEAIQEPEKTSLIINAVKVHMQEKPSEKKNSRKAQNPDPPDPMVWDAILLPN